MREVILSYWNSVFTDLIRPYRDDITAISALIVAIFAVVLARVAWKQSRDAKFYNALIWTLGSVEFAISPQANWWAVSISKMLGTYQHKNCVGSSGSIAVVYAATTKN